MSAQCLGMERAEIKRAAAYYREILGPPASLYNRFHTPIYLVLCILGVLANACFIVVLCRKSMRRNPFNHFLIAIAFCDGVLMASYFAFKEIELCNPIYFTYWWTAFTLLYAIFSVYFHSLSLWLTSTSSGSSNLNTSRSAVIAILMAVVISLIGSAPNMVRYEITDAGIWPVPDECFANHSRYAHNYEPGDEVHNYQLRQPAFWSCFWDQFSFWTAGLLLKILPCILLTVFMIQLIRLLVEARNRKARLCSTPGSACGSQAGASSSAGKGQAERTTTMLTIIVAVFLLTELPQGSLITRVLKEGRQSDLINSSVNFILYTTMSQAFRSELVVMFGFCFPPSVRRWHSKRRLKSNGASIRGPNTAAQTPTKKPHRLGAATTAEQTERLIENGEPTDRIHLIPRFFCSDLTGCIFVRFVQESLKNEV
ncbi:G-PROTEIN-RECEP-F1-2 domain-containing protein [Aphelenchoides fujianensis]|nr:G-PROTEIN-RECEP-F1-2 domain-containing protein [Aphelenchoides fujianensis]